MISQKYKEMLGAKSVIRQMSEWAAGRAKEIGSENVFDFSLGNPSVAVPAGVYRQNDSAVAGARYNGIARL